MSAILGVNAVFHDPAAALVVDGVVVAAAEEERFSRRKHGKTPVPFATWELPESAIGFCLDAGGVEAADLDAVAYSYDPALAPEDPEHGADAWESLRTLYASRAPQFLHTVLADLDVSRVRHVPHHVAHAASAYGLAPFPSCAVLVLDGRGERTSGLTGHAVDGRLEVLTRTALPNSLGLWYEELTAHLGYRRSSDEYKVMAMASYGSPRFLEDFRRLVGLDHQGRVVTDRVDWSKFAAPGQGDGSLVQAQVDLASTVQSRLEEVLVDYAGWLGRRTGERCLAMAGGIALNCVANSRIFEQGPFEEVWVQPAAGDAGTALGAAVATALDLGEPVEPMQTAALGPAWDEATLRAVLENARVPFRRPDDLADAVAERLADDAVVAWFQGRSEFGPRALGHRSLLAHPGQAANLDRLNDIKGREKFRPVAPLVLEERAADLFCGGPLPSPYMLFTHRVAPQWQSRIPAVVHVDGTARIQTVNAEAEPALHRCLCSFERRTGLPALVNTSLNTAGRPMVDSPRDALECFGSAPIDVLALGPFLVERADLFADGSGSLDDPAR